jgi:hypothetical protein
VLNPSIIIIVKVIIKVATDFFSRKALAATPGSLEACTVISSLSPRTTDRLTSLSRIAPLYLQFGPGCSKNVAAPRSASLPPAIVDVLHVRSPLH